MRGIKDLTSRKRVVAGAVLAILAYLCIVVLSVLGFAVNSYSAGPTDASFLALFVYFFLFAGSGAVIGALIALRPRLLRYAMIGALCGALLLSFQNAIWPLAVRMSSKPPTRTVLADAVIGAGLGVLGGLMLLGIAKYREALNEGWPP